MVTLPKNDNKEKKKQHRNIFCISGKIRDYAEVKQITHIYIYIYIYTNLMSTSIHGTRKKEKKPPGTRDKNISNHRPREKEKIL